MGDRFQLGVDVDLGRVIRDGFGHGHRGQDRPNPLQQEAWSIARDLDNGNTQRAVQRLNNNLHQLPFEGQRYLVENIERADRKGIGADLHLGRPDRRNGLWDDIRIVENFPPQPYYGRGGQFPPGGRYPDRGYPGYPGDRGYPGYPGDRGYPNRGRGNVDIHIDLNIFKHRR